jgi:hypothetical protein
MPRVRRRDLEVVAEDDDVAAQFAQAEAADDRRRAWAERILGGRGAGEARGEDVIFAHPEAVPINEEAVFIPMEEAAEIIGLDPFDMNLDLDDDGWDGEVDGEN